MNEEENRPLGARLFDAIDSGIDTAGQFIAKAAEDKPGISDDIGRGGIQGLSFVGNLPVIKQIGQAEEAIVGGVRNLAERQDVVDPRAFTYGTRIGLAFAADKGIGKVVKAGQKAVKVTKAVSKADEIMKANQNPMLKNLMMKQIDDPNFEQLGLDLSGKRLDPTPNPNLPDYVTEGFRSATADVSKKGLPVLPGYMDEVGDSLVFNYKQFRKSIEGIRGADGRKFLELFQTPMSRILKGQTTGDRKVFDAAKKAYVAKMRAAYDPVMDAMGMNIKKPFAFQMHHISALKTIMGIFDGVGYDSQLHRAITDRLLQKVKGLGNQSDNLMGVMGAVTDKDTTHQLTHLFLKHRTGMKGAGEALFTDDVLIKMRASDDFRLKMADKLGDYLLDAEVIARQAQGVLDTLYAQGKAIDPETLVNTLNKLDDQGYLKGSKIGKQYQVQRLPKMVEEIVLLQDAELFFPNVDIVKVIGKGGEGLKNLKTILKYAEDGTTPPANVINKLRQKDLFKTKDQQFADALENWAITIRKRRATLKQNATRRNQQQYFADPDVYNVTRDPRFQ